MVLSNIGSLDSIRSIAACCSNLSWPPRKDEHQAANDFVGTKYLPQRRFRTEMMLIEDASRALRMCRLVRVLGSMIRPGKRRPRIAGRYRWSFVAGMIDESCKTTEWPTVFDAATCVRKGLCPVMAVRGQGTSPIESHSLYFGQSPSTRSSCTTVASLLSRTTWHWSQQGRSNHGAQ